MNTNPPILYSFRRCPYAMRARMAIVYSAIYVELREVVLRDKPLQLLEISAKATVPVLLLADGKVLEESLDIMHWALSLNDKDHWLKNGSPEGINSLIQWNDGEFKYYLDRYKYADRYPQQNEEYYREKAEIFIRALEERLNSHDFLCGKSISLADIAIFPFIRQFANVDIKWFQNSAYKKLDRWLKHQLSSALFISIMEKYPAWSTDNNTQIIHLNKSKECLS